MKANDCPVTDAELNAYYGIPVTADEIEAAKEREAQEFDAWDYREAAAEIADKLNKLITEGDYSAAGRLLAQERENVICRRASYGLFGHVDGVTPERIAFPSSLEV